MTEQQIERRTSTAIGAFEGASVTDVSLAFDVDITEDRAAEIAGLLGRIDRSAKWWLGDWMLQYVERWGIDKALHTGSEQTGYSESALSNWQYVTEAIPVEIRDARLDFTTYIELAKLVRNKFPMETVIEVRDRLIKLREEWPGRGSGVAFPNHKVAREIVEGILKAKGIQDVLFYFPTTEEQIAEQSAEIARLRTELEDTQLAAGTHVRCPRCSVVQGKEQARVRPDIDQTVAA